MSEAPRRSKGPPPESDLSQVMAHGAALSQAYGKYLGALLLLIAISKTRRGALGILAGMGALGLFILKMSSGYWS
jgi:hypothetical protein